MTINREHLSNTLTHGSVANIGDMLSDFLPPDNGGGNAVFKGQGISLMRAAVGVLVDLRDHEKITLNAASLREWMLSLGKLMSLSDQCKAESGTPAKQEYADLQQVIRPKAMAELNAYLAGMPGFRFDKKPSEQGEDAGKQFGFAKMYWVGPVSTFVEQELADA